MLSIRLDPGIERRLSALAKRTGRTKTYAIRLEVSHRILPVLPERLPGAREDVDPSHADVRIEALKKRILQLLFSFEFREFSCNLAHLVNIESDHAHSAIRAVSQMVLPIRAATVMERPPRYDWPPSVSWSLLHSRGSDCNPALGGRSCRSLRYPCRKRGKSFRPSCKEPGQHELFPRYA